jgi:hypothetical protein
MARKDEEQRCGPERSWRLLFEKALPVSCAVRPTGAFSIATKPFARIFGCESRAELDALNAQAFYYQPSDRAEVLARLEDQKYITQQEICFRPKG